MLERFVIDDFHLYDRTMKVLDESYPKLLRHIVSFPGVPYSLFSDIIHRHELIHLVRVNLNRPGSVKSKPVLFIVNTIPKSLNYIVERKVNLEQVSAT